METDTDRSSEPAIARPRDFFEQSHRSAVASHEAILMRLQDLRGQRQDINDEIRDLVAQEKVLARVVREFERGTTNEQDDDA